MSEINPTAQTEQAKTLAANYAYHKAYREANREADLARKKAYREANRERVRERAKAYREANVEKERARKKAYDQANPDKVRARRLARAKPEPKRIRDPEKARAYHQASYHANPEKMRENRVKKRGLTLETLHAMEKSQDFRCDICRTPFSISRYNIDHDHATGKVRGLLCSYCNFGLGFFQDNAAFLRKGIKYLKKHANGSS